MQKWVETAAAAKSLQSCPTLCDPIDSCPPGSPVPGILQVRTLEWVAISFSNAGKWKVKVKSLSRIWLLATPWTAAHQAPPSMGFSRQEYWSGVLLPSPGGNWGRFKPWKTEVNHRATHFSRCLPWGHSSENKPKTSLSLQLGGREWMELEGEEELEGRKSEKGGS